MRGWMSVPWGDGCSMGGCVFQGDGSSLGDGCSRGMGNPWGWVFQVNGSSRGMGVLGGWVFQGDECSGGRVSRGWEFLIPRQCVKNVV